MRLRAALNPWLVLAVGFIFTVLVTVAARRVTQQRDRLRFENAVNSMQDRIGNRLHAYEALLRATAAFVTVRGTVSRAEFKAFVEATDVHRAYPGIQGVGLMKKVAPSDAEAFTAKIRGEGLPDFRVWPDHPREWLMPITYLEPLDRRNAVALAYDMTTEPVRREAIERARDTGQPALSGRVTLVQEIDPNKQAGFLMYFPVYRPGPLGTAEQRRAAFDAHVYAPFRGDDFFAGIFETERARLAFSVYDGDAPEPASLIHATKERVSGHSPLFSQTRALNFAGRRWTIAYETGPVFEQGSTRDIIPYALVLGIAISVIVAVIARGQWLAARAAEAAEARAELERRNLYALFQQAPAAVAILRGDRFVYELSNPLNNYFAGNRELVGKAVLEALPEAASQGLYALLTQVYRSGQPFVGKEVPVEVRQSDDTTKKLYLNGVYEPLRNAEGRIEGVLAFAYDVTELVIARQKVEALAEDLRTAVRARDDFLAIAGHELKTPLTALSLQLQSALHADNRAAEHKMPVETRRRVERAVMHLRRLQALVNELLDVSRISSGRLKLEYEDLDFAELLREVTDRLSQEDHRLALKVTAPASIRGRWDRIRAEQVLTNLVSNALKYGAGKPVELDLAEIDGRVRLSVTDHGIGIAPEDQERIFGRFERAVSERNFGGLGLGLWISRQIVEAFQGTISCISVQGQGSTFTVELPLRPPP